MTILRLGLAALLASMAAIPARGDFTASYTFAGSPGDQRVENPDAAIPGLVLSGLQRDDGLVGQKRSNTFLATGFPTTTTLNLNDDFFFLTLGPGSGSLLDLDRLEFFQVRNSAGPQSFQVRTSLDGFANPIGGIQATTAPGTPLSLRTIDFGADFLGLTSPLEVRFYGTNAQSETGGAWWFQDDGSTPGLRVFGAVRAVPEPASLAMLALGGLVLGLRVRKRLA